MPRFTCLLSSLVACVLLCSARPVQAARPSESLLPATTKGYVSLPSFELLEKHWNKTQLGEMVNDPIMKPFIEDLREQLRSKLLKTDVRLNLTIDDLRSVCSGEACLATVQPDNDEKQHAMVAVLDVTGRGEQVQTLLAKISKELAAKGAQKSLPKNKHNVVVTAYLLPRQRGATEAQRMVYFVHEDRLIAADHEATALEILARFFEKGATLQDVKAFQVTQERCRKASGDAQPHAKWFVEPFGYVQTLRASAGGRKKRGTDMLKVLANQGFTAVRGVGGWVSFAVDEGDILHRTFIYAPAVDAKEKYKLAARMLNFPNHAPLSPEAWVPHEATNYASFNWKMKEAFEYSKTLVDEIAGAPVFDDVLESLAKDEEGPRVDLRTGLVQHLGERVSFVTDYRLPVGPTCERWLVAFEVKDPGTVGRTLDKAMEADPSAKKHAVGGHTVWEITEEQAPAEVEELKVAGGGFGQFGEEEEEEEERAPLLEHAAFAVAEGRLMVASHLDFIEQVLARGTGPQALDQTKDFVMVENALAKIGAGVDSVRYFARTDKSYHPTYELIRQGKMPESKTLFANLLNRLLGPDEPGVLREQQIKGGKMPEFEKIRGYFGPAGIYVNSEADGWFVAGCVLRKPEAGTEAAGPVVSRRGNDLR